MIRSSVLKTSALLCGLTALVGCGKTEAVEDPAYAIDGVVLFTDGEAGGNGAIAGPLNIGGGWYTFDDKKDCGNEDRTVGMISPGTTEQFNFADYAGNAPTTEDGGSKGIHVVASSHSNFAGGIGLGFGPSPTPHDLTAHKFVGVRFVARATNPEDATATSVQADIKLTDATSEPLGGVCAENAFDAASGTCPGIPDLEISAKQQGCFDAALKTVDLTATWTEYRVYFTKEVVDNPSTPAIEAGAMARGGWGTTKNKEKTTTTAFPLQLNKAFQFQIQITTAFDFWIDNIGFIVEGEEADTGMAAP